MPYRAAPRQSTRVLRLCLDVLAQPSRCTVAWDSMGGDACVRECPECSALVHDVSRMAHTDAEAFLAERMSDAPPKLDLFRRPDGRVMDRECAPSRDARRRRRAWKLILLAGALLLVGLASLR